MHCFSMIKKFIGEKFMSQDPILPLHKSPASPASELKTLQKNEPKVAAKKSAKKSDEDDDLFKEMQPSYVAARRIGATTLATGKKSSSTRFDMDAEGTHSWEVEDFN